MTLNIIQVIDSLQVGGAQSLLLTFAATVQPLPVKLTLVSLQDNADSPVPNALRDLGVTIHTLPAPRLFDIARIRQLTAVFKQEKYDVVHTHLTYANILGTVGGRLAGIPVMATLHNIADTHLSLSPDERSGLRRALMGDEKRPLLISIGRLTSQKTFPDLLPVFSQVRKTNLQAALIIAGTGEDYGILANKIDTVGLSGYALIGVGHDNLPEHYLEYPSLLGLDNRLKARSPRSLYLQLAAETGIIGLLIFGTMVAIISTGLLQAEKKFMRMGEHGYAEMSNAFIIGLIGYMTAATFLHAAYPRYMWLLFGIAFAIPNIAANELRLKQQNP